MSNVVSILPRNDFNSVKGIDAENCPYCNQKMVKHIVKEGARYHVHSYDTIGVHCSTKDCEDNHGPGKCVVLKEMKLKMDKDLPNIFDKGFEKKGRVMFDG